MEAGNIERRKYARLDLALTVSYKVVGHSSFQPADPRQAVSADISLGGLRLMTPARLENGTLLDLEILLGEDEAHPINADGEVIWQNKLSDVSFETGVMIKGMPAADKRRFMEFVFDQMAKLMV